MHVPDYLGDERLTRKLMQMIQDYWGERGKTVNLNYFNLTTVRGAIWNIRSDMVNGLPLRRY
jgi:hypothetical protein